MVECYILSAEIMHEKGMGLDSSEIRQFINFIESIISDELDLLYSNSMFNLHKEFQCALASLEAGLELIFIMEEALLDREKPFTLRYVITLGELEVPRRKHLNYGLGGLGLARAVSRMERLRLRPADRFYVDMRDREESNYLMKLLSLYQNLIDSWPRKDCRLVANLISFWDYTEIAKSMNKDPSQIWKRRKTLKIQQYNTLREVILSTPDLIIKNKLSKTNEQPPAF